MEDFNRERQLYSLAISPQFVPMMYFCEEVGAGLGWMSQPLRGLWALPTRAPACATLLP